MYCGYKPHEDFARYAKNCDFGALDIDGGFELDSVEGDGYTLAFYFKMVEFNKMEGVARERVEEIINFDEKSLHYGSEGKPVLIVEMSEKEFEDNLEEIIEEFEEPIWSRLTSPDLRLAIEKQVVEVFDEFQEYYEFECEITEAVEGTEAYCSTCEGEEYHHEQPPTIESYFTSWRGDGLKDYLRARYNKLRKA